MTPEKIEQERKAFEEWYYDSIGDTRLPLDKHKNGCYCNPNAEDMFTAWCAAKSRPAQSEWISVEERLPEVNGTYLGFNNNAGMVGAVKFYKCHTGKGLFHDHRILNVTHWQPLPEPPETRGK